VRVGSVPNAVTADVSVLVDRLSDMEGLMRELAQAQVANTAVLQQIGGRLPSPVPPSPDSHAAPGAFMGEYAAAGDYRGSPGEQLHFGCVAQHATAHARWWQRCGQLDCARFAFVAPGRI
jgi:hypothetical protein